MRSPDENPWTGELDSLAILNGYYHGRCDYPSADKTQIPSQRYSDYLNSWMVTRGAGGDNLLRLHVAPGSHRVQVRAAIARDASPMMSFIVFLSLCFHTAVALALMRKVSPGMLSPRQPTFDGNAAPGGKRAGLTLTRECKSV